MAPRHESYGGRRGRKRAVRGVVRSAECGKGETGQRMKFLHLADLHLGKVVNEFSMVEDQRFVLDQIVALINQRSIDAVLIAGDIYDKTNPSSESVALADEFLGRIASTGARVIAIAGNHDSDERVAYASGLLKHQGIYMTPVFGGTISPVELSDEYGPVLFWPLPFLRPSEVRGLAGYEEAEIGTDYTAMMREVIARCQLDTGVRNVALAHQFVTAGSQGPQLGGSEMSINVGTLDNINSQVFDPFDYVALGHIHRPQRVGRDEVRYAGSPLCYHRSEMAYEKTVPVVELGEKGQVTIDLVPVAPLHAMREVRGALSQVLDQEALAALAPEQFEDYLFVTLTNEDPVVNALADLRRTFPNTMAVSYDNSRTRASGAMVSQEDVRQAVSDPFVLFEQLFEAQNGRPMDEFELSEAKSLFDSIVKGA